MDCSVEGSPAGFIGRAAEQVNEFIAAEITPIRKRYADALGTGGELKV